MSNVQRFPGLPLEVLLQHLNAGTRPGKRLLALLEELPAPLDARKLAGVVEAWIGGGLRGDALQAAADAALGYPSQRLIVYGSLARGECHDDVLASVPGQWSPAAIHGEIDRTGTYPRFTWRPDGPAHAVQCFAAPTLPQHWPRLDAFEGDGYRRIWITAQVDGMQRVASIYEAVSIRRALP